MQQEANSIRSRLYREQNVSSEYQGLPLFSVCNIEMLSLHGDKVNSTELTACILDFFSLLGYQKTCQMFAHKLDSQLSKKNESIN